MQQAIVANNLAYMLALQGETEKSNDYVQRAVRVLGPTADLRDTIGMVHYARGDFNKAIREFEAATAEGDITSFKYIHLGMAHAGNGNAQEAARAVKRAYKLGLDTRQLNALEFEAYEKLINQLKNEGVISDDDIQPSK